LLKELFTTASKSLEAVEKADKEAGGGSGDPLEELMGKLDEKGKAICKKVFAGYKAMEEKAGKYDELMAKQKQDEEGGETPPPPEVVPEKKELDVEALTSGIINQIGELVTPIADRLTELETQVKSLSENEEMANVVASLVRRLPEGAARRPSQDAPELDQESIDSALERLEKTLGNQPQRPYHPLAGLGMGAPGTREGGGA
jgi:hypothetical protein